MLVANRASTEVIDVFIDLNEKRSEGKKCKPGEAREKQNDGR
jgi:hypothetical protein